MTDWLLAGFSFYACYQLVRVPGGNPKTFRLWFGLFLFSGLAALLGGVVHGLFNQPQSLGHTLLWPMTMLSILLVAAHMWSLSGALLGNPKLERWFTGLAITLLFVQSAVVLFVSQTFVIAIASYAPALICLTGIAAWKVFNQGDSTLKLAFWGLLISLLAPLVQQLKISIHPFYFTHNSLYHCVQLLALWLIYRSSLNHLRQIS